MSRRLNAALVSAVTAGFFTGSAALAQDIPTAANFTFKTKADGRFHASVEYDLPVPKGCNVRLIARSLIGGDETSEKIDVSTTKITAKGVTKVVWKQADMPRVKKTENGAVPEAHMGVRLKCDGEVVLDSNVFARKVRCGQSNQVTGLSQKRVTMRKWLYYLKNRFAE